MRIPKPGEKIAVSLGVDKKDIKAIVSKTNCWAIEYSIEGCRKAYPNKLCTKRLNSALNKFKSNSSEKDLLKFDIPDLGKCYAGAMIDGFGKIGDVAEVVLDDVTKFNFMILDTKSKSHRSSDLSSRNQCQNKWGHGYMLENNKKVQLSICEFIVAKSKEKVYSAKDYDSGAFLKDRYVKSAKIVGHANIK